MISRQMRAAIKQTMFISVLLLVIFVLMSVIGYQQEKPEVKPNETLPAISDQVLAYRPLVEKYAAEHDIAAHVNVLLAIMMQESAGRGKDPMQASESYCGKIGCIQDVELSIRQGVRHFASTLKAADGDMELAIQSYNFGKGFISYVQKHSGQFSEQAAIDFSKQMYERAEDQTIYTCLRKEAKQYDACYGDIYYVRSVQAYQRSLVQR